jgi:hypothetical protein
MVRAHSSCNVYRTNLLPAAHQIKQQHKTSLHNVDSIMAFRDEIQQQQIHLPDHYASPRHSGNLLRPVCGPGGRSLNRAASSPRLMPRTNSGKGHYRLSSVVAATGLNR